MLVDVSHPFTQLRACIAQASNSDVACGSQLYTAGFVCYDAQIGWLWRQRMSQYPAMPAH